MRKNSRLIFLLAIIKFILPYLLQNHMYEPHRDEFLYLAEGQHLAWGYLEIPPFLSLFAWLIQLFGDSIFWIKFWPDLFGTLTFVLCARIADKLEGKQFAIWLVFFPFVFGAWLRMFFLFQPNAPEIFFCTLMSYAVFRYIQTSKNKWLYIFGIAVGLGMLSKYTVAFWLAGILVGLILTKHRSIFKDKHFYFSGILGFLIFLPNLLWQAVHNFPVFHHMKELKETQLQYVSATDFFKGEFLMYLPVFFVWIAGLLFCFSFRGRTFRVFGIAFLTMQAFMLLYHGKSYYTAGSFTILFSLGAVFLGILLSNPKSFLRYACIVFPVLTGIMLWPVLLPVFKPEKLSSFYERMHFYKAGITVWEDHQQHELPQDFADMLGWKEMTAKVSTAYNSLSEEEKENMLIWCDNYGQAGAINFYRSHYGLPEAYSENGSFIFWYKKQTFPEVVILVSDDRNASEKPELRQFESVQLVDSVTNKYAVEHGSQILILKKPSENFQQFFKKRLDEKKRRFGDNHL